MGAVAIVVAILGTIYLMLRFKGFGLTVLGAAVFGGGLLWLSIVEDQKASERRHTAERDRALKADRFARSAESVGMVRLENVELELRSAILTGVVVNASQAQWSQINGVTLRIQIYDCERADPMPDGCGIVADFEVRINELEVPTRQKRAFSQYVTMRRLPEFRRGWHFNYTVAAVYAWSMVKK